MWVRVLNKKRTVNLNQASSIWVKEGEEGQAKLVVGFPAWQGAGAEVKQVQHPIFEGTKEECVSVFEKLAEQLGVTTLE